MKLRFLAALVVLTFGVAACESPEHKSCSTRGSVKYSSEHGTFHCKPANGRLQWER